MEDKDTNRQSDVEAWTEHDRQRRSRFLLRSAEKASWSLEISVARSFGSACFPRRVSHYFVMDWAAIWKDVAGGVLLAAALATLPLSSQGSTKTFQH